MNTQIVSSSRLSGGPVVRKCLIITIAMCLFSGGRAYADDEFQNLIRQIPHSANAIVLLNMEKAKDSPMGLREDWKAKIAAQMRKASQVVKTMGIQSGAREAQIISADVAPYAVGVSRWGRYGWYGGYGGASGIATYDQRAEMKGVAAERRAIRAEEKGVAATNVQQLRQEIVSATADIRRKMTQKYQMQF